MEEELEQVIREYLENITKSKYLGKLKVTKVNPVGYQLSLGLNTPLQPIVIYAELEAEQFLEYVKEYLKAMNLGRIQYGKLNTTMLPECTTINRACKCHDK